MKELYFFIAVDCNGKRLGGTKECENMEEAKNICRNIANCENTPICYYYSKKEWEDTSSMYWYFRNGLDYWGQFNEITL